MRQKIVFLFIFVALAALVLAYQSYSPLEGSTRRGRDVVTVKIGDGVFNLRVADDNAERTRGLGGVGTLAPNEGMLFIFPQNDFHAIWMKDMLLPIDILWLSVSNEVVDLREGVTPDSFPAIFTPRAPARLVVELSAGSLARFPIRVGERAEFLRE